MLRNFVGVIFLFCVMISASAQKEGQGIVTGYVFDTLTNNPVEYANVVLSRAGDSSIADGCLTNEKGYFLMEKITRGNYFLTISFIGYKTKIISSVVVSPENLKTDFGIQYISETAEQVEELVVTGEKSLMSTAIDRKVYNIGTDIFSKTGTASELLENIPSVQVDIDGNVSLRGSENVTIFINGKPSAMMGAGRAEVLQQLPANSIERIEVITNPSAKYKPDGTTGIINIVMKKNKTLGTNLIISANAGNASRYNASVLASYNPGKINIYGSYGFRQDDRAFKMDDYREHPDSAGDKIIETQKVRYHSRPFSHIAMGGIEYNINDKNSASASANYNYRTYTNTATNVFNLENANKILLTDYTRVLVDYEIRPNFETSGSFKHDFEKKGHELSLEYHYSESKEIEDNKYETYNKLPLENIMKDNTALNESESQSQFYIEYTNPINDNSKFEAGYVLEIDKNDKDFNAEFLDTVFSSWIYDTGYSNRFKVSQANHAVYTTYEKRLNKFGVMLGLRAEQVFLASHLITTDTTVPNNYFRIYPTLHFSYNIDEQNEIQFNYSRRVNRPRIELLNPFPEYRDKRTLRIGNPLLMPEDIHSVEVGHQLKNNNITLVSTIYFRRTYDDITFINRYINDSVLLTTRENLDKSSSAGFEFVLTKRFFKIVSCNLNANVFYNTIDASALGYSKNMSTVSYYTNLNLRFSLTKATALQIMARYSSPSLTPQGKRLPFFMVNAGLRHEMLKKKLTLVATVSDIFNTMSFSNEINTPELYQKSLRQRASQIFYVGLTYTLGKKQTRQKEENIKFDSDFGGD